MNGVEIEPLRTECRKQKCDASPTLANSHRTLKLNFHFAQWVGWLWDGDIRTTQHTHTHPCVPNIHICRAQTHSSNSELSIDVAPQHERLTLCKLRWRIPCPSTSYLQSEDPSMDRSARQARSPSRHFSIHFMLIQFKNLAKIVYVTCRELRQFM